MNRSEFVGEYPELYVSNESLQGLLVVGLGLGKRVVRRAIHCCGRRLDFASGIGDLQRWSGSAQVLKRQLAT